MIPARRPVSLCVQQLDQIFPELANPDTLAPLLKQFVHSSAGWNYCCMRVQVSAFEPLKSLQLLAEEPGYPIVWLMIAVETRKVRVLSKWVGFHLDAFLVLR